MSAVALDNTPVHLLARFRGVVVGTRLPHSRRTYFEVIDAAAGKWRLRTWRTTCSSTDDGNHLGKTVLGVAIDERSGVLEISFSDGSACFLRPHKDDDDDAIENWEIFTPEGLILAYGPQGRWLLGRADDPDYWVGWAEPLVRI
jgi:hypothetical protein